MPSDSYYDRLDEAEDNRRFQYEKIYEKEWRVKHLKKKLIF